MRKIDRRHGLVLVVLLSLAAATGATIALRGEAQGQRVAFRTTDVAGRTVDLRSWRGRRVVLVTFTGSDAKAPTRRLLERVDDELLNDPVLETVLVADGQAYDNILMRPFAMSELRSAQNEAMTKRRSRRRARGADASSAWIHRYHTVADWDGAILRAFGLTEIADQPVSFVVDGTGRTRGPFRGGDAAALRRVLAAIEESRGTVAAPAPH